MVTLFILMIAFGFLFPSAAKYLIAGPILGFCFGGFAFAVACCINASIFSFSAFGAFIFVGTLITEVVLAAN